MRFAVVRGARDAEQLARYLPFNYEVVKEGLAEDGETTIWLIAGEDNAGWTLDDYVIPRLASGMVWAKELVAK